MKILNTQQIENVSGGFIYLTENDVIVWDRTEMEQEHNLFIKQLTDYFNELKAEGIMVIEI